MKKNYKIISIFFVVSFLILAVSSCSIFNPLKTDNVTGTTKRSSDETSSSFDFTKELNTLKEKLVNPPVIISHKPYTPLSSNSDKELVFIKGKSDIGTSIALKVNGILIDKKYVVDNYGDFEILDGVEIAEGTNTVEIYAVNASGEKSESTKLTFLLNIQKDLDFAVYENADNLIEISSEFYSREIKPLAYIQGVTLPVVDVYLRVNNKVIGQTLSGETGVFSFPNVQLSQGSNVITAWYELGDGQISAKVDKEINVFKDTGSPDPSSLTGYIGSDGNHLGWVKSTDAGFVSYKIVRVDDPAKNPHYSIDEVSADEVIASIADKNISSYIDKDIISGKAYFYTLWILDKAGNLTSSNVLPLPAPKYTISMEKLPTLQGNVLARREWYYEYFEITNTGNVPVYIQPIFLWFLLDPESESAMALNPLWAVYIWDPNNNIYYYNDEKDMRKSYISEWIGDKKTVDVSYEGNTKITTVIEFIKIAEDNASKRLLTFYTITTITRENTITGETETDPPITSDPTTAIVEPEEVGGLSWPAQPSDKRAIQPGDKIKIVVKIANVAADNGDKIVVHFHFAPADSYGIYFAEDIVSTEDIFITSSGK